MTRPVPTAIAAAPSVAEVVAASERLGRVDFTSRLSLEPESGHRRPAHRPRVTGHPDVVPRARRAVPAGAAARAPLPELPPAPPPAPPRAPALDPTPQLPPGGSAAQLRALAELADEPEAGPRPASPPSSPAPPSAPPGPVKGGILALLLPDEDPDDTDDETAGDPAHDGDDRPDAAAGPRAVFAGPDADDPVRSVDDVARGVVDAMRTLQEAHERHLVAIELEAARRIEVTTAQAELDAQLIRLHARREAHDIVATARERSGLPDPAPGESEQLGAMSDRFSRFAETIETTLHPRDDDDTDHDADRWPDGPDDGPGRPVPIR